MSSYEIGFPLFKLELIGGQFLNRKGWFPDRLRSVHARSRRDVIPVRAARTRATLGDIAVLLPARRHRSCLRYLLCESNGIERRKGCLYGLEHLFRGRRLPQAIRSDNGVPFAPQQPFTSPSFQFCGCGSVSALNALNPGIPSRTAAVNAGSHTSRRRPYLTAAGQVRRCHRRAPLWPCKTGG